MRWHQQLNYFEVKDRLEKFAASDTLAFYETIVVMPLLYCRWLAWTLGWSPLADFNIVDL